jgi:hypothetical protein
MSSEFEVGMRFWLPGVLSNTLPEFQRQVNTPFPAGGTHAQRSYPNISYKKKPLTIRGERWIDDPAVCAYLMSNPGPLRFDPQEAIDKGLLTADQVRDLGFVNVQDKEVEVKPMTELDEPVPDFNDWTVAELREWANDHGMTTKKQWSKGRTLKAIRDFMKEGN